MIIREKSIQCSKASQLLIDKGEALNTSVSLAYYSVFLYMKHLLAHTKKDPIPYEDLEFKGADAHKSIRSLVVSKINSIDCNDLEKRIKDLHDIRIEAEYKDRMFSIEEAMKYKEESVFLRKKLKYFFNNILEESFK